MYSRLLELATSIKKGYFVAAIALVGIVGAGSWYSLTRGDSNRHSHAVHSSTTTSDRSTPNTSRTNSHAPSAQTPPSSPSPPSSTSPTAGSSSRSTPALGSKSKTPSTPASSSPSSGSSSGSTSPPPPTYSCITSDPAGHCPFSAVSYITGVNSDPYVDQNIWNGGGGYQQTLYANSPEDWYITANANTNFGGVLTYPNTGFDMTGTVDSFSSISSSWNVTIPTNGQTAGWAAYDLWFNNWNDEVMIQTDLTVPSNGDYDCTGVATITVSGISWHMCDFGSERVWKPGTDDEHLVNRTSGTVDVKAFLTWMEQNGKLPAGSTWTAGSFGFEVCDTGGSTETFQVNGFSWDAQ